jgi:Xaa-Pro aminopeptidase
MVVTVEPGTYIPIGSDCDKNGGDCGTNRRWYSDYCKWPQICRQKHLKSDAIEQLMQEKSMFDGFTLPTLDN